MKEKPASLPPPAVSSSSVPLLHNLGRLKKEYSEAIDMAAEISKEISRLFRLQEIHSAKAVVAAKEIEILLEDQANERLASAIASSESISPFLPHKRTTSLTASPNAAADDDEFFFQKRYSSPAPPTAGYSSLAGLKLEGITRRKAFERKPRFLCLNTANPALADVLVSGSMDGMIQFWSIETKSIIDRLSIKHATKSHPEATCWNDAGNTLAIVCETELSPAVRGSYLQLFSDFRLADSPITAHCVTKHLFCDGHQKPVRCIASIPVAAAGSKFVTGSDDKAILCWTFDEQLRAVPKVDVIHCKHTSTVTGLLFDKARDCLISAGLDCRLLFSCLAVSPCLTDEVKLPPSDRLCHILAKPGDPNILLLSMAKNADQLLTFDVRAKSVVQKFGWPEQENISRYVEPAWHPNGRAVACGATGTAAIHLWDCRFLASGSPAVSLQSGHERGRLLKVKFQPQQNGLFSCSTADCNLNFIETSGFY